jgi:hypothetical protein
VRQVNCCPSPRQRVQSYASAVLVAAFYGAKTYNPRLRNVLLLYLGTVNTRRQFQMLSCEAAQGNDCLKCSEFYQAGVGGAMKPISD